MVNPKSNKYLFDIFDQIFPIPNDERLELEVVNKDEEDIENPGPYSSLSKRDLQHLLSRFNRYHSRLWD